MVVLIKETNIYTGKLKAFTLIESLIAIIVIMICFWVSTMIYLNIIRSEARLTHLKAFLYSKEKITRTNIKNSYIDEDFQKDSLIIKQTIEDYNGESGLKVLHIQVFEKNKKRSDLKQIIISE